MESKYIYYKFKVKITKYAVFFTTYVTKIMWWLRQMTLVISISVNGP